MPPKKKDTTEAKEVKACDCTKSPIFPLMENFTKRQLLLLPDHLGVQLSHAVIVDKSKMPACDALADPFLKALHNYRALTSSARASSSALSEATETVEEQTQASFGV